jgi:beta-lactamase class C
MARRIACLLMLMAGVVRGAPTLPIDAAAIVTPVIEKELLHAGTPGVAVVVVADGAIHYLNFGYADTAAKRPVTEDSIFELASITKVFTTTALALAVQRGDVKLTESIAVDVPALANGGDIRRVTLEQLATHTSRLPRVPPAPGTGRPYTMVELLHWLCTWHAESSANHYLYSNLGVGLLGIGLAARAHLPLAELYARDILQPLSMTSTFLEIPASARDRLVQGYAAKTGRPVPRMPIRAWAAGGGLCASARDMAVFLEANLGEGRTPTELQSAMRMAQAGRFRFNAHFVQALGWQVIDLDGRICIDKNGGLPGTSTYIGFLSEQKIGIVILCNRGRRPATQAGRQILRELAAVQ